jgi:small subunit ribosomal protein S5
MAHAPKQVSEDNEWKENLIDMRRVTTVTTGGRRFSISASAVTGDGKGRFGFGTGKAAEAPNAIKKANLAARRNMHRVELNGSTLQHAIKATHGATTVVMIPASKGTGIIAGKSVRALLEVVGIEDVLTKVIGSSTPINVVHAVIKGLTTMRSLEHMAEKRGKRVEDIKE